MMNDKDIRIEMKKLYKADTSLMVDELAIPKKICLADLVRIPKDGLSGMHGYEIKSEIDSLNRLESQVHHYSEVFQYCTLVVAEKHEEKAVALIPDWWGVIVVASTGFDAYGDPLDKHLLLEVRPALENPSPRTPYALTQLLWRTELLDLIKTNELALDKKARKSVLRKGISKYIPSESLEQMTVAYLIKRVDWKIPGVKPVYTKRKRSKTSSPRIRIRKTKSK